MGFTTAPLSSLCAAPVEKAVLRPLKKPYDVGATTPVVTPARLAMLGEQS